MNKELQDIIAHFAKLESSSIKAVLATVVDVKGSSYRLPGARMLIGENGEMLGTVSGGCLEADVLVRAQRVLQTGISEIFIYDTTGKDDSVFSLNMGCRGVIRILLEPVKRENDFIKICRLVLDRKEKHFVATLISTDSLPEMPIAGKIFFNEQKQFDFVNLPEATKTSTTLLENCLNFFRENHRAQTVEYRNEQGVYEFFFENINPPLNILIFGAGADAVPLAEIANKLGWRVSVFDHRAAFANKERFPKADEIILARPENLAEQQIDSENTAAVVMTHNYKHDKEILRVLLNSDVEYIGSLGPKRRAENILQELIEQGERFSAEKLDKLYAPIGLDIGADTPESIALSIIAEINSVIMKRDGGFLRDRKGSIYNRNED
ncbi:MAG TPA: XdhC/CoxI family protein [Pyrinomonadaceae bacterium]